MSSPLSYPPPPTSDQVDQYHGQSVADPYRPLEEVDAPATREWIARENELTFSFLAAIPERETIRRRIAELWDYPRLSPPRRRGRRYFQLRNTGLQNQDVLFVSDDPRGRVHNRILLDPNTLSADGTVALMNWAPSPDGRYLAYATSGSGSDWLTWRVRDVDLGADLPDLLEWSKFSDAAWLPDGSGFFYTRYDPPPPGDTYLATNEAPGLFFHPLGAPQTQDLLVYARPDHKDWGFAAEVTPDGHYLILHVWQGTDSRNRLFYRDLNASPAVVELIPDLEAAYHYVGSDGPLLYLRTDLDAPRGRLVAVDVMQPEKAAWRILVPESTDVLEHVTMVHDEFVALYRQDAADRLQRFALDGAPLGEVALPALGSVYLNNVPALRGLREHDEFFYLFQSFVYPPSLFRYDMLRETVEPLWSPSVAFDPSPYITRQVMVTSKDGTRVPMFLVHRADLQFPAPTWLYGYGGFNVPMTPSFAPGRLCWLEMGGVIAVANLRGGSEYGEEWHRAGSLHQKQNVFDDFIACAEYLVAQGLTLPAKLAIEGRSNGGLLVGACMTQRPELFGAAVPGVGVMDMLRFHKFTIGWAWVSDYGSPDEPAGFATLFAYSPLHRLRPGAHYPATLILTGDHDDRVVPGHSFKFAAALQAVQGGDAPVLIRIQTRTGHGLGKPTSLLIEEQADIWSFLVKVLGMGLSPALPSHSAPGNHPR